MALPLETTNLIAQLRVSYLTLTDNDEYARRIIKPLAIGGYETEQQQNIYTLLEMSESPPITFNANHHLQNAFQNAGSEVRKTIKKKKKTNRNKHTSEAKNVHKRDDRMNSELLEDVEAPDLPERPQTRTDTNDTNGNGSTDLLGLSYTKTIKGKNKKSKPNIVKFFHSSKNNDHDSESDSDSDDTSRAPQFVASERNLELIEEENANEEENEDRLREGNNTYEKDTNDAITIDSDFEVPVTASGEILKTSTTDFGYEDQVNSLKNRSNTIDTIVADEDEDIDVEEDSNFTEDEEEYEDEDDEDEEADISSTDSAFTDIETDSILESSMLLDSYNDNAYNSYSFGTQNDTLPTSFRSNSKKLRKKKSRVNSFDSQSISKHTANIKRTSSQSLLNADTNGEQIDSMTNSKTLPSNTMSYNSNMLGSNRKNTLTFGKVDVSKQKETTNQPMNSKLSMLIQSRYKSSNMNPLNYYSFASSYIDSIHKASLNIYIPPSNKPVITNLSINDNVAVSDCIGYILLKLSCSADYSNKDDPSLMNPNKWRLELVDEDGDNYGSFGILDRTRLLSSYNNPRDIALCKINDQAEIIKNGKQAPLPMEFRQNLLAYEKKQTNPSINSRNTLLANGKDETIELKILKNINVTLSTSNYSLIFISARALIGKVLDEFCVENGLDPSKYKLREILISEVPESKPITHKHFQPENSLLQGNLGTDMGSAVVESKRILRNTDSVFELESNTLELIQADVMQSITMLEPVNNHSFANMAITPSESTSTLPLITPPAKQIEEKFQSLNIANEKKLNVPHRTRKEPRRNTTESIKRTMNSNKYLDDIIRGKNLQLPTNINTIYFTWKVWRKKPTILNKIEKTLIIDGDYIHLTPSDVMVWKKNPSENPFLSNQQNQSQSHHHHHYLHHYNYSNYYNSLMMKTSSFHITQITKLKQYKKSKNPNHFKIVIKKQVDASTNTKDSSIKKKYDLEAANVDECEEIIQKIKWVLQVYNMSNLNLA